LRQFVRHKYFLLAANAGLVLSLMMVAGRLTGFLRELMLASRFGAGAAADAAIVLLTLPDLFTGLLLAGGLSAALVPAFKQLEARAASVLFVQVAALILGVFSVFAVLIYLWPGIVVNLVAPGLSPGFVQGGDLTWVWVGMSIVATALTGVSSAMLNAKSRFGVAGAGTLIFNITVMLGLSFATPDREGVAMVALFVMLACLVRLLSQLTSLGPVPVRASFSSNVISRELVLAFLGAFGATSLFVLVPVVLRSVGSLMGPGSLAMINYATKLVELPLGIVITTISIVALPAMAEHFAGNDTAGMRRRYRAGTWRGFLLALAIAIPMITFSNEIVAGIFGVSGLSTQAGEQVGRILQIASLTLPLIAISSMQGALLNASARSHQYFRAIVLAFACFGVFIAAAYALKNFDMLVFSMVVFHLGACVFLRLASGEAIFSFNRSHLVVLCQVLGVALVAIALGRFSMTFLRAGALIGPLVLAGAAVAITFLFSLWAFKRVKETI
jgi:putative peptidoglycan lipid II flippase